MFDQAEGILSKLIGYDTTSAKSNKQLIEYVKSYLENLGVTTEIVESEDSQKASLWATIGSGDKPGIVLAGHTDTVPVKGQVWASDPFELVERGGKFFGRGTCDMKGFIACVLAVVPEFQKQNLPFPIHLAFTHDEEFDMSGADRLTVMLQKRSIKPQWVWIGEPTSLHIIDSHKGVAAFQTTITGVPAHSGKPALGLNAIELGADFMTIVRNVAKNKESTPVTGSKFDPPYTTFNLAIINGGTAENIIPEHCEIMWQARAHPGDDLVSILSDIQQEASRQLADRLRAFAPRSAFKTCTCFDIPPLLPTQHNIGTEALGRYNGFPISEVVSFATEGGFFQKLGTHVVICGPGSIDQAHKADEYVERSQLSACIDLLVKVPLSSARP